MKKIFLIAILVISCLEANDKFNAFVENMKTKKAYYTDINNSTILKKQYKEEYNIPSLQSVQEEHEEFFDALNDDTLKNMQNSMPWITKNMIDGISDEKLKEITGSLDGSYIDKKVDTVFYLFSTSQTEYSLYNFVQNSHKLESVNSDFKYYGVVQGLLNKQQLEELYKPFKYKKELEGKAIIKMHPLMFKDLELTRVPAYLFSSCPSNEFKYKECDNKFIVRGDISFVEALEIVAKEDKHYEKYLKHLQQGDY